MKEGGAWVKFSRNTLIIGSVVEIRLHAQNCSSREFLLRDGSRASRTSGLRSCIVVHSVEPVIDRADGKCDEYAD
jgi:hypothetical protein